MRHTRIIGYMGVPDEVFSQRAEVLKHRLKWGIELDKDGLDKDKFDTDHTTYILVYDDDGKLRAHCRLLNTYHHVTMQETVFASYFPNVTICGPMIWEVTRVISLQPDAFKALARGCQVFGQSVGASSLLGLYSSLVAGAYSRAGIQLVDVATCERAGEDTLHLALSPISDESQELEEPK